MENYANAICYTLIHSLWQGIILACITGMIIIFTRRSTAAKRYLLLVSTLFLFFITCVVTFFYELNQASGVIQNGVTEKAVSLNQTISTNNIMLTDGFKEQVIQFINVHSQNIILLWFIIVVIRSLQLFFSLKGLYMLRNRNLVAVDEMWIEKVQELAANLGMSKLIRIAESGIAKVPMVMGHLKPLILIPVGLLTTLPPAEIEAILIHELAHIRRRDYLMNLLQSFMEIVFFFNPAVLWISALIRTERENCCDDVVISQTCSKAIYIKALVSCQEYHISATSCAIALTGKSNLILDRVKRMVSGNNYALNIKERAILFITILSAGLLTIAFTKGDELNKAVRNTVNNVKEAVLPNSNNNRNVSITEHNTKIKNEETATIAIKQELATSKPDLSGEGIAPVEPPSKPAAVAALDSLRAKAERDRVVNEELRLQLIYQMVKDGVINKIEDLESFKLSTEEFIVNNKKQPDDIYQKYRKEYVKITGHSTWSWYYNYDTSAEAK